MRHQGTGDRVPRSSDERGLTIVELLIALVVLMIVFAALASTVITSLVSTRNTEARVRAVALANELVEEMVTIPYERLGLWQDELIEEPLDPADDPVVIESFEDEVLVLLPSDEAALLSHRESIVRDGREYQVQRWVTWVDADEGQDLKRIVVLVSWNVNGRETSIRSETLRAPDPLDLFDLGVSIKSIDSSDAPDGAGVRLWEQGASADPVWLTNSAAITIEADVGDVESSIVLRFRDRNGVLQTIVGAPTQEGLQERTFTIAKHAYQFAHGPNAFTLYATGGDGQVASDTANFRFFQAVSIGTPTIHQLGDSQEGYLVDGESEPDPEDIPIVTVDPDGAVCGGPLTVDVSVAGMTGSEAIPATDPDDDPDDPAYWQGGLTLEWTPVASEGDEGPPLAMEFVEGRLEGGRFEAFPTHLEEGIVVFTIDADRNMVLWDPGYHTDVLHFAVRVETDPTC